MLVFNGGRGGGYGCGQWSGGLGGRALDKDAKTETLKMIVQRSNLCQRHSPRTNFNSWKDWIPYPTRLRHKSTGDFRQ